ncbi:uncharacterized protein LOC144883605 [Branchiostoma floridae x Branchiostoma japonicum]
MSKPRLGLVKTRQDSLQTFSFVSAGATLFGRSLPEHANGDDNDHVPEKHAIHFKPKVSVQEGFDDLFKSKPESWDCEVCMVSNPGHTRKCLACSTPKPEPTSRSVLGKASTGIGVGFTFSTPAKPAKSTGLVFSGPSIGSNATSGTGARFSFNAKADETSKTSSTFVSRAGNAMPSIRDLAKQSLVGTETNTKPFSFADALEQKRKEVNLGVQDSTSEKTPTDLSQSPEKGWPQLSNMTFGASLTSGPDVQIIFEKKPTATQLTRALKYRLPPTFYFYEDLPVPDGYRPDEDFDDYEIWFDQWKAGKALRKDAPQPVQTTSTPTKDQQETSAIGTSSIVVTKTPVTGGLLGSTTANTDTGLFEGLSFSFGKLSTSTSTFKGFTSTTETKEGLFVQLVKGLFATPEQQTEPFGSANKTVTAKRFRGFVTQSSTTDTSTGLFGATQQTPSLFGSGLIKSTGLFGEVSGTEAGPTGTTVKFNPVSGSDTMMRNGVSQNVRTAHQCIVAMEEYETKSLEELRLEDYLGNRKGGSTVATALFKLAATPQAKGDLSGTNASSTRLRLRARRKRCLP